MLDQQVLYQRGCFKRVRRYLRGIFPERGIISKGYTGFETIEEVDVISAIKKIEVREIDQ